MQYSVRDFANYAWSFLGKKIRWEGEGVNEKGYDMETSKLIIAVDSRYFRPAEVDNLLVARINVILVNKPGSLGKVTTVIAQNNGNISNIHFTTRKSDFFEIIIDIEVRDKNHLSNIIAALRLLPQVSTLERIKG